MNSIVVRRVDESGQTAGLTAVYTGSVSGNRISGSVQWLWPNHPGYPAKGSFAAVLQDSVPSDSSSNTPVRSADTLPSELLVCENNSPCNAAWIFTGSSGTGTWFARKPTRAALTVVRQSADYIVIRRKDTTGDGVATYAGSQRDGGYTGTIVWSTPGQTGDVKTGTWTATVPQTNCTDKAGLEPEDAMRTGQYALMFKRDGDAFNCYLIAAKAGDATAQAAVGLIYYQGRGAIAQDYREAFSWLHKAADQGIYAAQRTVAEMYLAGMGTDRDKTQAAIYTARADEQKHDLERRQDAEERAAEHAADRANRLLSSFVLGASFGLFF